MGIVSNVDYEKFPQQGPFLNKRTKVCFRYNMENTIMGTIVRDDIDPPFLTIIHLDDGRFIMSAECQYSPIMEDI